MQTSNRLLLTLASALLLPSLAFATCPVNEIDFIVASDGTLPDVTRVWLGNMVSPDSHCSYYCTICPPDTCPQNSCPSAGPTWTWEYDGSNCNAFGIEFNFEQKTLGVGTAIGTLIVDPTKMVTGSKPEIHVVLSDCAVGPNNCLLRVNPKTSTQGPGISFGHCDGTPECTLDPSCRLK